MGLACAAFATAAAISASALSICADGIHHSVPLTFTLSAPTFRGTLQSKTFMSVFPPLAFTRGGSIVDIQ